MWLTPIWNWGNWHQSKLPSSLGLPLGRAVSLYCIYANCGWRGISIGSRVSRQACLPPSIAHSPKSFPFCASIGNVVTISDMAMAAPCLLGGEGGLLPLPAKSPYCYRDISCFCHCSQLSPLFHCSLVSYTSYYKYFWFCLFYWGNGLSHLVVSPCQRRVTWPEV